MWNQTRVSERLGIRYPIIQGPFGGGLSTIELTAAVSNAGGMGSFGAHHLSPLHIKETVAAINRRTTKPFAMNLWIPLPGEPELRLSPSEFAASLSRLKSCYDALGLPEPEFQETFHQDFEDQIDALLEARPPVFSFVFGIPSREILTALRQRTIKTIGTATTVDEACGLEEAGVDLIVASGSDAGGHRPSFLESAERSLTGTLALIPQVTDAVRTPIIAAGGIGDERGIIAAFVLGAEAAQLGTVFLATHESGASEAHKAALVSKSARTTALTRVFSGRLARGIRNRFIEEMTSHEGDVPPYPIQNWLTHSIRRAAAEAGRDDYLSLWAGQAAALSLRRPAAETFAALVEGTEQSLRAAAIPVATLVGGHAADSSVFP
jgi:nitronate monooxygenase